MATFADMLVYLRKRDGLSQVQLAEKTGLKRSAIGMYETGKREPDFETLEIFADFFNVNMDTLLGKEPKVAPHRSPNSSVPQNNKHQFSNRDFMAAFFEGAEDLTDDELAEMWEDARGYLQYKLAQKRRKNNG